jgi:hypothetical protein
MSVLHKAGFASAAIAVVALAEMPANAADLGPYGKVSKGWLRAAATRFDLSGRRPVLLPR